MLKYTYDTPFNCLHRSDTIFQSTAARDPLRDGSGWSKMPTVKGARVTRKAKTTPPPHDSARKPANQKPASSSLITTSGKNKKKNVTESADVDVDIMYDDGCSDHETSGDESGEEVNENEVDMVEMPVSRSMTPIANDRTNEQENRDEPVSPLKADRKRTRTDTASPQKPTRPASKDDASKDDSEVLRQRLSSGLGGMVSFLQQASVTSPEYDFYENLIDHIRDSIVQVENRNRLKEKEQGLAASMWAKVAADPKGHREPITIKERNPKDRSPKIPSPKGPAPKGQSAKAAPKKGHKESKEDRQVILKLKKDTPQPTLQPLKVRNELNAIIKTMAVTSVELSARRNIVITTNKPYTSKQLLERVDDWKCLFSSFQVETIEEPTSWVKLVAHGVPVLQEIDAISIFQQEVETFNPVKVKGSPRWLKQPAEEKRAGSVVFAVPTEEEANYSRKNGLYIAGVRVKVAVYKAYTNKTQCYRCQGYGHNPATCNKPVACAICSKRHLTRMHKCNSCSASQQCEHTIPSCINCKGKHAANSKECEVYKAITS